MAKRSRVTGVDRLIKKVGKVAELKPSEAKELADQVALEMKKLIAKGVSPIQGSGRFPEYLAAGRAKAAKKAAAPYQRAARAFNRHHKEKASIERELAAPFEKALASAKRGYPYSVQGKYPGKKPRPVNLFLSGKFLSDLEGRTRTSGSKTTAEVGIYGKLSVLKEKGHREGANGQPSRPIIPDYKQGERFSDVIRLKIERYFRDLVKKNAKKG